MRKTILVLAVPSLFFLSGCAGYIQLYSTGSDRLKKDRGNAWIFENDTLRVSYEFWSERGLMSFSIYNKLDKPIYVDWRKSSFVSGNNKFDYWIDEEKFSGEAYTEWSAYRYGGNSTTIANGKKTKRERITFITPHAQVEKSTFYIYNPAGTKLNLDRPAEKWPRLDKGSNSTNVFVANYNKENSKLIFRNFLTISTSEKFESESYIDNEFYISQIAELKLSDFTIDKKKAITLKPEDSAYQSPDKFFIKISNSTAIAWRKKMGGK